MRSTGVPNAARQQLLAGDVARQSGRWDEARQHYASALKALPGQPIIMHNIALCYFAQGKLREAVALSERAYAANPKLWQSGLILAKALIGLRDKIRALPLLQELHAAHPDNADIRVLLAGQYLHQLGDPAGARRLVSPLQGHPVHGRDAWLTRLITELYDRDRPAQELSDEFVEFAAKHLQLEMALPSLPSSVRPLSARLRVGLLSPQFFVSPVYFFSFGALQLLAAEADLVFFNRGHKQDWGTQAFRNIATDWLDVAGQDSEALAKNLAAQRLDVLIDLGGWMDPVGLRALSAKPARCQFKWVGGQSHTTGLASFDGFITDAVQTPEGVDHLYTEPLIRVPSGYVSYTPPDYLPEPEVSKEGAVTLAINANPSKISPAFLRDLGERHAVWRAEGESSLRLRFIDRRYRHQALRQRIREALPDVELEFVEPADHREYLQNVAAADAVLDTWPYSGGLTTVEALAMGVPSYTRMGTLFSERHTGSHLHYAGLNLEAYSQSRLNRLPAPVPRRSALLRRGSDRTDHLSLATFLLALFERTIRTGSALAP